MPNISARHLPTATLTAFMACIAFALASNVHAAIPLASAKTIQVTATVSQAMRNAPMRAQQVLTVKVSRPGSLWIKQTLVSGSTTLPRTPAPAFLIVNGKTQYEYDAQSDKYAQVAAPEMGSSPSLWLTGKSLAMPASMLLPLLNKNIPSLHEAVSLTKLNGKPMKLTTEIFPSAHSPGTVFSEKIWRDAATLLPYRDEFIVTKSRTIRSVDRIDFARWILNRSLPAAQFAWTPPATAKRVGPPTLLTVGTPAPDFAAIAPDGSTVHLSDYKGRLVVLDFWATWCVPCQIALPHLEKVWQQVKDKDVAVLGVCVWDNTAAYNKWRAANMGTKYTFPIAFDPASRNPATSIARHLYGVSGIPTQYVIDKEGKVAATNVGDDAGGTSLESSLSKLGVAIAVPPRAAAQ